MAQFKVVCDFVPLKESRKDFQPHKFEEIVNKHLQEGWRIINCNSFFYFVGATPENGIHYWAYLVRD